VFIPLHLESCARKMTLRIPENLLVVVDTPKYEVTLEIMPPVIEDEKKKILLRTSPPQQLSQIETADDLLLYKKSPRWRPSAYPKIAAA
jgi:hypothetical protein